MMLPHEPLKSPAHCPDTYGVLRILGVVHLGFNGGWSYDGLAHA